MSIDWTPLEKCLAGSMDIADIGVSVIAPDGQGWEHRGERQYPSASTAKIPIMVEIYRMVDRGQVCLDDQYELEPADKSPGTGVLRQLHAGLTLTVADLLYLMISISDNTATNILIEMAGMARINETMRELGMRDSILGRPMVGRLAIEGEQENLATPKDYTRLLGAICRNEAASASACDAMSKTLQLQQNAHRIGRAVPHVGGFTWGSKNGTNQGIVNDVGFVTGPAGTMLIAVYCRGVGDEIGGEAIIADIAHAAMISTGMLPG